MMIKQSGMVVWALLAGGVPLLAAGAQAATSATLDILSDDVVRAPPAVIDVGGVKPIAKPGREAAQPLPSGNPLWAVPLSALSATGERPIFSASRRPPRPAVVAPPPPPPMAAAAPTAPPAPPPLALLGAVVGTGDAIAVLLDRTTQKIIRLRQGESHGGWEVSSVQPREVTLRQAERTETLALQRIDGGPGGPAAPGVPGLPPPMVYPAGASASFAPFVPRATPKNGEGDGL
jgi:general secretion pathway protein N